MGTKIITDDYIFKAKVHFHDYVRFRRRELLLGEIVQPNPAEPSCGTLYLLDESNRSTDWDIEVNPTTSWSEQDLSAKVPSGTKAVYGFTFIANTDAYGIIQIRDTISNEDDSKAVRGIMHGQATSHRLGMGMIIKATEGKFDIKELSATNEVSTFYFHLWGYFK